MDFKKERAIVREVGNTKICVGHLPGRTKIALYVEIDNRFDPVAYFASENQANLYIDILEKSA